MTQPFPNTIHDQTDPAWVASSLKGVSSEDSEGTGLFIVPDPVHGADKVQGILVPNLSYEEAKRRGTYCVAFKWFPQKINTYERLLEGKRVAICNGLCPGAVCGHVDYCACVNGYCLI